MVSNNQRFPMTPERAKLICEQHKSNPSMAIASQILEQSTDTSLEESEFATPKWVRDHIAALHISAAIDDKWESSRVVAVGRKAITNTPPKRKPRHSDDIKWQTYLRCNRNAAIAARQLGYNEKSFARDIKKLKNKVEK